MKAKRIIMNSLNKLIVVSLFLIVSLFSMPAYSQVDFEFWFAAPYGNQNHAPQWPANYEYKVGGRPIFLRVASQDADAVVNVSIPAAGIEIASLIVPANTTQSVDLTPYINQIQCSNQGNVIENKGLLVRSNALITAYYEIASVLNTDIFSMKGRNALGTEFLAPFQNLYDNDPLHNGTTVSPIPDPAYSYIVIVATENNTEVHITPTANAVGIPAGTTKSVLLNKGQIYTVRASGQSAAAHLGGTVITSDKDIAVTIADDSMYPQNFTTSGDCEDYAGDQIVPTSIIGKEYIAVKGQGYKSANGKEYTEKVFITATVNNTQIFIDGSTTPYATLNRGQVIDVDLGGPTTSIFKYISASEPVYAFHLSGYMCEVAGALLPPVDGCTGSYKIGFVRTYGYNANEEFYMNLMVKGGGENNFLLNGAPHPLIQNATFTTLIGTDWKVARIYFPSADLPVGAYFLQNTTSLFHMAMMNSTAHKWSDSEPYRLMGSMYGYFSKFSDNYPTAVIVNNNDTTITVSQGTKVSLLADGGYVFNWTGYIWNGAGWDLLDAPYYLNVTNKENPYAIINTNGVYKYTASITTECYGVINRDVYIKIVPPANLNDIYDTVCATSPYTNISEYYNLFNLNDTIVGKQGKVSGYYVDSWYTWVDAYTDIWDDFELQRNKVGVSKNGTMTVVANPQTIGNTSIAVGLLQKTSMSGSNPPALEPGYTDWNDYNQSVWYDIDLTSSPIDLKAGGVFSFDIMFNNTGFQSWEYGTHSVYLELTNASGGFARILGAQLTQVNLQNPSWQNVQFDFTGYASSLSNITKARIRVYTSNYWAISGKIPNPGWGYYIDNIKRDVVAHQKKITNPTQYRITDGDSLLVYVKNYFELDRLDSTKVYFSVLPPGMPGKHVVVKDTCATSGNVLEGFDLTQYNYEVGGALVSDKYWYMDAAFTIPITNPTNVNVVGTHTYWARIDDECGNVGSVTVEVSPVPNVMIGNVEVCEVVEIGGDRGILNLSTMKNRVTTNLDASIIWYSDAAYTQLVSDVNQVFVKNGDVFYAKIYYNEVCAAFSQLQVTVIPLDEISFPNFSVCYDGGNVVMNATPSGGVYLGNGVTANQFNPIQAGEGLHDISYTISNQGCTHTKSATAQVYPLVQATITQTPTGKIQVGQSVNLSASITPAGSYTHVWTNAAKLVNPSSLNTATVALNEPTDFCITVTHNVTGCKSTVCTTVDVYVPVKVDLEFSANPVCAGEPVIVTAKRTGGFGPYEYVWNIPVGTDFTKINDSVVRLNNPQVNIPIGVTVTDKGKNPNDIVSDNDILVVHARPSITIANLTPSACQFSPLSINPVVSGGTPSYSHQWTQDIHVLSSAATVQNATINTAGVAGNFFLRYTVTDANGCKDSKDVTVQIYQKPIVTAIANPDTTCVGQIVQLMGTVTQGVTAGGTHAWISNTGSTTDFLDPTSIPNPRFQSYTYGVHRFEYIFTDANGCKDTSEIVRVRIEPKPIVTINPVPAQCESNIGIVLKANPSVPDVANPTFTYNWSGAVTSTQASPTLSLQSAGMKTVNLVVTANNGCSSDPASIQVLVNPNPLAQIINPQPVTVCADANLQLQANAIPGIVYTWDGNAKPYITPLLGASVTFNAPSPNPTTVYNAILIATDPITQCSSQASTDITVYKKPEVSLGADIQLCVGSSTVLNPTISYAVQPYSIKWVLDTTELSNTGTLNPTFTVNQLKNYQVGLRVTDVYGCEGYDDFTIVGLANPVANAGLDMVVDWNTPFNLQGSATGGLPSYSWLWQPKDSLTSLNTVANPSSILKESTWFELEVTDANGCKDIDSVLVTVVGQPISVVIVQQPTAICFGQSGLLEAIASGGSGEYTYEWFNMASPTVVIGTNKTLPITPVDGAQYMVKVSSASFEPATTQYTVSVKPLPTVSINVGVTPEVCLNSTMLIEPQVQGTSPFVYEWSDGSGFTLNTPTYLYSNSQASGLDNLNLKVTDANGCVYNQPIQIKVNGLPTVSIIPNNPNVCVFSEQVLTAVVAGQGKSPYLYTWIESTGKITSFGSNATFMSTTAGAYPVSVNVLDDNGCSANANVIVITKPFSTLALQDNYSVCAGSNLVLDINPNSIPGMYSMHWVGGDKNAIVDSTNILKSVFRSNTPGTYTLYYTIADANACPRLDTVKVTVYPSVTLAPISNQNACVGVSLPIEANITAGNPANVSYSWIGNVNPTFGKQTTFASSVAGVYNVKVIAGDKNCSDSTSFTVSVHPNPIVDITNAPLMKVPYAAEVSLFGNIKVYTSQPFTYSWQDAAAISAGQNTAVAKTIPITQTRLYTFNLEDAYGCKASAQITLSTEIIIPVITRICDDLEVPINPNVIVDPTKVCLTDKAKEICIGESVVLIPQFISGDSQGLTYTWTNDEGTFISNAINPTVVPTKTITTYTLTVENTAGYKASATFLVIAHPNPTASISVSPEYGGKFYNDDKFVVNGNPAGGSGQWISHIWTSTDGVIQNPNVQITQITPSTPESLSMTYRVTDSNGCKALASRTITLVPVVKPNITGNAACENSTITYSLDKVYPAGTTIIWSVDGGVIESSNNQSVSITWGSANPNAKVSVYINENGKDISQELSVNVGKIPNVAISGPVHVCQGDIVNYTGISVDKNPNITYYWDIATDVGSPLFEPYYSQWWDGVDDQLLIATNAATNPAQDQATVHWKNEGKDKVVLRARDAGCLVVIDLDVTIHPLPQPDFSYKPGEKVYFQSEGAYRDTDSIFKDKSVDFTNLSYPEDAINPDVSFFWDFVGDGVFTENSYHSTYRYDESGSFMVQLMAVDKVWGCKNIIAKPLKVVVNPNCGLKFPNAFTPDLSDNNTFYPVYNEGVLETGYELRIFNRWGTLLWSTTDRHEQWNGMYKGDVTKQDVYVYHCKAVCEEKDPETGKQRVLNIKGDVTVIR